MSSPLRHCHSSLGNCHDARRRVRSEGIGRSTNPSGTEGESACQLTSATLEGCVGIQFVRKQLEHRPYVTLTVVAAAGCVLGSRILSPLIGRSLRAALGLTLRLAAKEVLPWAFHQLVTAGDTD